MKNWLHFSAAVKDSTAELCCSSEISVLILLILCKQITKDRSFLSLSLSLSLKEATQCYKIMEISIECNRNLIKFCSKFNNFYWEVNINNCSNIVINLKISHFFFQFKMMPMSGIMLFHYSTSWNNLLSEENIRYLKKALRNAIK